MPQRTPDLLELLFRLFWTILFSLVPAVLLGLDFGFPVGIAYFVIAAAVISIHYDVKDASKAVRELAGRERP